VRTGLVTPGSVAAATSKSINVKTGDSVKGWFLTKCSPQDIVDRPVETGEKSVGQAFQWLAAESERGMPKRDKIPALVDFVVAFQGQMSLAIR